MWACGRARIILLADRTRIILLNGLELSELRPGRWRGLQRAPSASWWAVGASDPSELEKKSHEL